MYVVIFAAEELTYDQRMGHDIQAELYGKQSIRENSGAGKAFPVAPTCHFCGKDVPALLISKTEMTTNEKWKLVLCQTIRCKATYRRSFVAQNSSHCFG
jgi:hypothetical protein